MCRLPKQFWNNNYWWSMGHGKTTYERGKPSGEMTLFTIVKSVIGPMAPKVTGINVRVAMVYKRIEVSMSITRQVKECGIFKMSPV